MSIKKEPAETGSQVERGSCGSPNSEGSKSKGARRFKVEIFKDGIALNAPHVGNPTGKGAPPRGTIKGWSKASRRRMREFMLTHCPKYGFDSYSCNLTIPGPVPSPADMKRVFHNFQRSLSRAGGCAVWRLEIQDRGMLHWHMTASLPSDRRPIPNYTDASETDLNAFFPWHGSVPGSDADEAAKSGLWSNAAALRVLWFGAVDTLGTVEEPMSKEKPDFVRRVLRSEWRGADRYAAQVTPLPDVFGSWKRYLQDHNSKLKQAQIAEGFGRHWGVIGRNHFERVLPDSFADLNDRQRWAFLRVHRRLRTPQRVAPWSVFGRCLGYTASSGRSGRSVFFSNPATAQRIISWAMDLPAALPRVPRWHDNLKPLQKLKAGQAVDGTPSNISEVYTGNIIHE